jgi:multicomponent Na+:H+ antiporter subunit B
MIRSLILSTAVRILLPLLLLFSLFLLLRGHNEPGGGFVGGLVAASGFALYALAHGVATARRKMYVEPHTLVATGLLTALGSACFSPLAGLPFMTSLWSKQQFSGIGKAGTPFLFDTGVYLVVMGMVLMIVFSLMEE